MSRSLIIVIETQHSHHVCCDELWASSAQTTNLGMKWILWAQVQKLLMLGGHSLNLLLTRRELGGLLMLLVGFMCREL